ncbi:MAG: acylphosphatase [Marinilabiliaceae bacterium]|nr:acylphosphatase [Marinilabiliaceae bacterium]
MKRVKAIVDGRVQGVGFRYFVRRAALQYGVKGYVQNLSNGSVEIDAEGEMESLELFLKECKSGPRLSRVERVKVDTHSLINHTDFSIR